MFGYHLLLVLSGFLCMTNHNTSIVLVNFCMSMQFYCVDSILETSLLKAYFALRILPFDFHDQTAHR